MSSRATPGALALRRGLDPIGGTDPFECGERQSVIGLRAIRARRAGRSVGTAWVTSSIATVSMAEASSMLSNPDPPSVSSCTRLGWIAWRRRSSLAHVLGWRSAPVLPYGSVDAA